MVKHVYVSPLELSTSNLKEPSLLFFINNSTKIQTYFFLENKNNNFILDVESMKINISDSRLNRELIEYNRITDSLNNLNVIKNSSNILNSKIADSNYIYENKNDILKDSIITEWCLSHSNSFITVLYIKDKISSPEFDIVKLKKIYDKLDSSLFKYPTYEHISKVMGSNTATEQTFTTNNLVNPNIECNSQLSMKVIGSNVKNYQILIDNEIISDTLQTEFTIYQNLEEPIKFTIINLNDTISLRENKISSISFYMDTGINDMILDLDNLTFSSISSQLIRDNIEFYQIKKKYDTLIEQVKTNSDLTNQHVTENLQFDSISHLFHRAYYNKCISLPNSFICLSFLNFLLDSYSQVGIKKYEVIELFNCLGENLKKYPLYLVTKKNIEANFLNKNIGVEEKINTPLWKPK